MEFKALLVPIVRLFQSQSDRLDGARILALPHPCCVTVGKGFHLPEPRLPHLQRGGKNLIGLL